MENAATQNDSAFEGLPAWQVYRSYVEGPDVNQKPRMVDKMCRRGVAFSWFTLLLGPVYYLYRKQWLAGLVYFGAVVALNVVSALLPPWPSQAALLAGADGALLAMMAAEFVVSLAVQLAMCFAFYPIYRRSAMRVYAEWRRGCGTGADEAPSGASRFTECKNDEATSEAIRYLERKGGTSAVAAWAVIAVNVALYALCGLAFG